MIRPTTNGLLKSYRYNLQRSTHTLNKNINTVLTQRNFNTYADDPATAARCFQMRRSYQRTNSQYAVGQSVVRKYDQAWSAMESVVQDIDNRSSDSSYTAILEAINDPTGAGRTALGQTLNELARGIVQTMNCRYGDNFVFAGADGLNVPFTWDNTGSLCYRGILVDAAAPSVAANGDGELLSVNANGVYDPANGGNYLVMKDMQFISTADYAAADVAGTAPSILRGTDGNGVAFTGNGIMDATGDYFMVVNENPELISVDEYQQAEKNIAALDYLANGEKKFADLGLGLQEENGKLIESSAFNVALQGINFLGYGTDDDGDPKNIVSIISRMGEILSNCDSTSGKFADGEQEEFIRLAGKFEDAAALLKDKNTELSTEAKFLNSNQTQLENNANNLAEQFLGIEDVDLAEAITALSWAQYSYNAALKVGNSILSQSLMDYINT